MSSSSATKFPLKVMINKHKTKVLFAEANSDFINVLLSFLVLPLGEVVAILRKHYGEQAPAIGSISSLYKGLFDLDIANFSAPGAKEMLLNPQSSSRTEWRDFPKSNQYFLCPDLGCRTHAFMNISMYSGIATCNCGRWLEKKIVVGKSLDDGGDFIINPLLFIVTDDLHVAPTVTGIIQTLTDLGITDTQGAEMKSLSFGMNEICELLKLSLTSATPLTDMIIKKSQMVNPRPWMWLHYIQKHYAAEARRMVLKVCLQKSTNKFLFAEATDEFLDFLCSFLTIPLGGAEFLLGGNSGLKNIDNLYESVSNAIDDKYFATSDIRKRLINPKVAHGCISKYQFLPLSEEAPPILYYQGKLIGKYGFEYKYSFHHEKTGNLVSSFKASKELFVKTQTECFVSDDLTMSPSLATSILILNDLGIPLSDVVEMELQIGLCEALGILKASLTSKTALTDGLINPLLRRQLQ